MWMWFKLLYFKLEKQLRRSLRRRRVLPSFRETQAGRLFSLFMGLIWAVIGFFNHLLLMTLVHFVNLSLLFWEPIINLFSFILPPLVKLFLAFLFFSLFYWLPFPFSLVLLSFVLMVCWMAQPFYGKLQDWGLTIFFYGGPFLFGLFLVYGVPLLSAYVTTFAHSLSMDVQWLADAYWLPVAEAQTESKDPPAVRFEKELLATGVTPAQMLTRINQSMVIYERRVGNIAALHEKLPKFWFGELPSLEPPEPTCYRRVPWTVETAWKKILRPTVISDRTNPKLLDVGASWVLVEPTKNFPGVVDVRYMVHGGWSLNACVTFSFDDNWKLEDSAPAQWKEQPYSLDISPEKMMPTPIYSLPKTAEQLRQEWLDGQLPEHALYRRGMADVKAHLLEFPRWKVEFLERLPKAQTMTDYYELHSELCLRDAELVYRWFYHCVEEAKEIIQTHNNRMRDSLAEMRYFICGEYAFTSAQCPIEWRHMEEEYSNTKLWKQMEPYRLPFYGRRLGAICRRSFYPLSDYGPMADPWGALFYYWRVENLPPLVHELHGIPWIKLQQSFLKGSVLEKVPTRYWSLR